MTHCSGMCFALCFSYWPLCLLCRFQVPLGDITLHHMCRLSALEFQTRQKHFTGIRWARLKPLLSCRTTALQNHTSALEFLCHLAMSNNATRARKHKRVVVEGGLDSDSGEEWDVDIGVIVDGHGRSRTNQTLHISQTSCRHPQSLPPPPLNSLLSASPNINQPSDENSKRKQVRKILQFSCAQNVHARFSFQGASVMMAAFEKHFDKLQSAILGHEYDTKAGTNCVCSTGQSLYQCEDCFTSTPSCQQCLLRSHNNLPLHRIQCWTGNRLI
jgi:hypothetical protein